MGCAARAGSLTTALVLLFTAAALAPVSLTLEVREWHSGTLLYRTPVKAGERFQVSFVHSVERTPVSEVFEVRQDLSIHLVETVYKSFGAGLPTTADDGAQLVLERGRIRITGMNRRIGRLLLAVSPVPGHALAVGHDNVVLADLAKPGTGLIVRAVREPAVTRLLGGMCNWTRRERG